MLARRLSQPRRLLSGKPSAAAISRLGQSFSSSSRRSSGRTDPDDAVPRPLGFTARGVLVIAVATGAIGWGIGSVGNIKSRKDRFDEDTPHVDTSRTSRSTSTRPLASTGGDALGFATPAQMGEAIAEIEKELGQDAVSVDEEDLHSHGFSSWSTVNPDRLPVAVAYPRSTEEVSAIVRVCHRHRVPVVPYSGGSSLEGNFSAPYGGVSIDFLHMNKILQINATDMDVVVQPSLGWQDLNTELAKAGTGLFFPIDPGPTARIGGMVGTNCSGTNAVRYGTMKDWVINLTVVLADGRVIKTRRRPRKSAAGYNLNGLFVGSEGTLGLVTEATLKLAVIPEETSVAVVNFPSIRDAASAAAGVMRAAVPVQCMEILDDVQMRVVNLSGFTSPRTWEEKPTLFFKFSGSKQSVQEHIRSVEKITADNRGGNFEFAKDEQEQHLLWSARKQSLWSMLALRKEGEDVWSTDVAVPLSRLADLIEVSKKEMDDLGLFASILGHIGDGNFHESIMYNRADEKERVKVEACVKNMVKRALDMDGTCTGEHGVGWGKKESLLWELGHDTVGVMAAIKQSLDPRWILNPGKIMDVPWDQRVGKIRLSDQDSSGMEKKGMDIAR